MMSSNPKTLLDSEKFESCGLLAKPVQIEELHENLQNCIFKPMDFHGNVIYIKRLYTDLFRVPPGMAIEFQDMTHLRLHNTFGICRGSQCRGDNRH